nr:type V CRISPR-associated protein Cas12k [Phormidium sp. FACHB-592]
MVSRLCDRSCLLLHIHLQTVSQKRPQQKPVEEKQQRQTSTNSNQQSRKKAKKGTKKSTRGTIDTLTDALFEKYTAFEGSDLLSQCAIAHIIKNDGKVAQRRENSGRFTEKFNKRKKQLERLEVQLAGSLPKGRDLTGAKFLEALETASRQVPADDNELRVWQANLLRRPKTAPYPLIFHSSTDLNWSLLKRRHPVTQKIEERIFVHFQGMEGKYVFEICCDRRQLPFFQQFLRDQEVVESDRKRYSASQFLLCSATLIWEKREDKAFNHEVSQNGEKPNSEQQPQQKQQPWEQYELYLHCAIDHRCLTAEGTELVVAEVVEDKQCSIESYEEMKKVQELDKEQQKDYDRLHNQLKRLENPFPRPQRRLYKEKSNILVGLGFSREEPVTAVVIDTTTGKLITGRNTRQLLGEDYPLLSAYRLKQRQNARQRQKDQVKGQVQQISESEQGKYLDHLLTKAVVALAKEYQAGSIVLPKLKGLRERLTSAIEARAEEKFPGDVAKQEAYTKQYKINVHNWSYSRLSDYIRGKAAQTEIAIEFGYQLVAGQFIDQAKAVAMSAFHHRKQQTALMKSEP